MGISVRLPFVAWRVAMLDKAKLLCIALGAALAFGAGWLVNGWRLG